MRCVTEYANQIKKETKNVKVIEEISRAVNMYKKGIITLRDVMYKLNTIHEKYIIQQDARRIRKC